MGGPTTPPDVVDYVSDRTFHPGAVGGPAPADRPSSFRERKRSGQKRGGPGGEPVLTGLRATVKRGKSARPRVELCDLVNSDMPQKEPQRWRLRLMFFSQKRRRLHQAVFRKADLVMSCAAESREADGASV